MIKNIYITKYGNKKNNLILSVIICTVNRLEEIKLCLKSLISQSNNSFEVIVVDGRWDNELESVCEHFSKYLFIKRIIVKKHNLAYSRNTGIKNISTPIAAFLDDDAMANKYWVENISMAFSNNKNLIGLGGTILSANNKYFSKFAENFFSYGPKSKSVIMVTGANMAFNIKRLRKLKGIRKNIFNENFPFAGEETEACLNIVTKGGKIVFDPNVKVKHLFETRLGSFAKKHYSYGQGDLFVAKLPEYKVFNITLDLGRWINNNHPRIEFLIMAPIVALIRVFKFINRFGFIWLPAILIREFAYASGIYVGLLKINRN